MIKFDQNISENGQSCFCLDGPTESVLVITHHPRTQGHHLAVLGAPHI